MAPVGLPGDVVASLGAVFAFGSEEKGQLGNGQAGERIVSAGKSAFDFEEEPSTYSPRLDLIAHFPVRLVTILCSRFPSSRQGACRTEDRRDCLRSSTRDRARQ